MPARGRATDALPPCVSARRSTPRASPTARSTSAVATGAVADLRGWWLDEVWELTTKLTPMLTADIAALAPGTEDPPSHVTVLGGHGAHVERGAYFEPYVLMDTTDGPVLVRRGDSANYLVIRPSK